MKMFIFVNDVVIHEDKIRRKAEGELMNRLLNE